MSNHEQKSSLRSVLDDYLFFRNGKTSPVRGEKGSHEVFGSNGIIGWSERSNAPGPVIVIGRVGSFCGSLRYSPDDAWVTDNAISCTPRDSADTRFWYYALQTLALNERSSGSGQPLLNHAVLGSIPFEAPEPPARRAIEEVLGALDDKIAANTKLAATTDDFLAAHFASNLRDHHEMVRLATIASVNEATAKPTLGGQVRYIDIAAVGVGVHEVPDLIAWEDAPSRARRKVSRGDTLWSTVRPNRRSHSLNLSDDLSLVGSTGLAVLTPTKVGFAYLYEVTKLPEFTSYLETVAEGSAYPAVRADRFDEAMVPLLGATVGDEFESLAAPIREYIHNLGDENRTLAVVRDALLPQLMSGKLRVRDAEKVLEGVL